MERDLISDIPKKESIKRAETAHKVVSARFRLVQGKCQYLFCGNSEAKSPVLNVQCFKRLFRKIRKKGGVKCRDGNGNGLFRFAGVK